MAGASGTSEPSAPAYADLLPIAGVWRVRLVLAVQDRSGLIAERTFDEETYRVTPGCKTEPCDTVQVKSTPLGLASPVQVTALTRDGATYTSKDQPTEASICATPDGDRVAGGATATSRLKLWMTTDRPAGSSVASTLLRGVIDLVLTPTSLGESAGCEPQTASFDLSGRREEVAVRDPNAPTGPQSTPPPGAALVGLPKLTISISGVTIRYFPINGDTFAELAASIARGGAKVCGLIDYEWYRGDARPSACAVTRISDPNASIRSTLDGSGNCRIASATFKATYRIHFPQWTAPNRVPRRLLDWWRRIVDFIRDHEAGHVKIGRDFIKRLNTRLKGIDCNEANAVIRRWAKQLSAAQEAYDRKEYSKPWPTPAAGP